MIEPGACKLPEAYGQQVACSLKCENQQYLIKEILEERLKAEVANSFAQNKTADCWHDRVSLEHAEMQQMEQKTG